MLSFLLPKEEKVILKQYILYYQACEFGKVKFDTLSLPPLSICEIGGNNSYQMSGWKENTDE